MHRLTAEWVRKAEADHIAALALTREGAQVHDAICFHCQQCAEKYLKAVLHNLSLPTPRTHDLNALLKMLMGHYPSLKSMGRGLHFLTQFAVETRYPGDSATKRQAASARRWAERVRNECRDLLGLPRIPRRRR